MTLIYTFKQTITYVLQAKLPAFVFTILLFLLWDLLFYLYFFFYSSVVLFIILIFELDVFLILF